MIRKALVALSLAGATLVIGAGAAAAQAQVQGRVARPTAWLGIEYVGSGHIRITDVIRDSPADIAGLAPGDVVLDVGGRPTPEMASLMLALASHKPGDTVQVRVRRGRQNIALEVQLAEKISDAEILRRRLLDQVAPQFALSTAVGGDSGSSDFYRGKVLVLAFLSPKDTVSEAAVEHLANVIAEGKGHVVVLGISSSSPEAIKSFAAKTKAPFSILYDAHERTRKHYQLPVAMSAAFVVVGHDGFVRYADGGETLDLGRVTKETLRAARETRRTLGS